jgi:signal transduction histidine kinase
VGSWIAAAVAMVSLAVSLLGVRAVDFQTGISLGVSGPDMVVNEVWPNSPAERDGVQTNMVVLSLNGHELYELPHFEYPEWSGEGPEPTPFIAGPSRPTPVSSPEELDELSRSEVREATFIDPVDLAAWQPDYECCLLSVYYYSVDTITTARMALLPGLGMLLLGIWWLATGRGGQSLKPLAVQAAAAAATPLFVQPMLATNNGMYVTLAGLFVVVSVVPLSLGLAARIESAAERQVVHIMLAVLVAVGTATAFLAGSFGRSEEFDFFVWLTVGAIPLAAGLAAAGPIDFGRLTGARATSGKLLQSTEYALVGATPLVALGTDDFPYLWPLALWLGAIVVAGRFTVRPLARLVTRAQLQRDLVVAATEAERARVAADIHDDALQELTLLVRRLETAGDTEGAEMGRTIADRLRAICGDLRLPILDDLGVGPALDWLVLRIERLAGGEVRLERADGARLPPDVELAIFRIAQEALANAVKHGRPPIVVRYRSSESGASLSIDDAGPGIAPDAPESAEQAGRFGLLNMQQRAEQIGAILDIRRWPAGGTHVALEWRPR